MNSRLLRIGRSFLACLALAVVALATGCSMTDPDNQSSRPWNATKSWEGGVPGMLYDRR
jgi:hypothetical protein